MLCLPIILTMASFTLAGQLHVMYEWKYVDYAWKSKAQRNEAICAGKYNRSRIVILDMHKLPDGRLFVTTPHFLSNAVPASLSTVCKEKGPGGPLLQPYPNWKWHQSKNCTGILSVWRITVDKCNRLWVVDSGTVEFKQVCPPKILVFDLNTDKLLHKIEVPDHITRDSKTKTRGRLAYPAVETRGSNCEETWLYSAFFLGGGIVVYNGSAMWRRDDDVFHPKPPIAKYSASGEEFTYVNGLSGLALTPEKSPHPQRLFFRPSASLQENSVFTKDLQKSPEEDICSTTSKYRFPSRLLSQAFSRDGILFFGMPVITAIGCWNMNTPMDAHHWDIVAQNNETLQAPTGLQIVECSDDASKDEVWITTNRFQKFIVGKMNFSETNFRILRGTVDNLVKGCKCDLHSRSKNSNDSGS